MGFWLSLARPVDTPEPRSYRPGVTALNLTVSLARAEERLGRPREQLQATEKLAQAERLPFDKLPEEVREALINTEPGEDKSITVEAIAFYAFNYGAPRAMTFASGLPLEALRSAEALTGWRPKSHALLQAVIRFRERAR